MAADFVIIYCSRLFNCQKALQFIVIQLISKHEPCEGEMYQTRMEQRKSGNWVTINLFFF